MSGTLTAIYGCMFAGKTEELIRRLGRLEFIENKAIVFKPYLDHRYGIEQVKAHSGKNYPAIPVKSGREILELIPPDIDVVAIDEAQFFDMGIIEVVRHLIERYGYTVIVAGLPLNFRGEPFGPMPTLISMSNDPVYVEAYCVICHANASRTQRLVDGRPAFYDEPEILVGAAESYEARCIKCHIVPRREEDNAL
jgi:thymidine kinase